MIQNKPQILSMQLFSYDIKETLMYVSYDKNYNVHRQNQYIYNLLKARFSIFSVKSKTL